MKKILLIVGLFAIGGSQVNCSDQVESDKKEDVIWRKDIFEFIKSYNKKNYFIFIVTNQSGVGRGYYTEEDVKKNPKLEKSYWDNKRQALLQGILKDPKIMKEEVYVMGVRIDTWKSFNKEGELVLTVVYKDGKEVKIDGTKLKDK